MTYSDSLTRMSSDDDIWSMSPIAMLRKLSDSHLQKGRWIFLDAPVGHSRSCKLASGKGEASH